MAGLVWQTPPQTAWPAGAEAYARAVRAGVHGVMMRWAPEIEAWMKSNASWVDRTGNARQGLRSEVLPRTAAEVVGLIELNMFHSVTYGVYLEGYLPDGTPMMRPSAYKIIEPALDHFGPRVWADVRSLFR